MPLASDQEERDQLVRRHLVLGWAGLSLVVAVGLCLELLHAAKAPLYLDLAHSTTRLMWRLAHAHLGVLSLASLAFAFTVTRAPGPWQSTSRWLTAGSLLLPLGFFLGGLGARAGDPGLGIVLVPPGALAVFIACLRTAARVWRSSKVEG